MVTCTDMNAQDKGKLSLCLTTHHAKKTYLGGGGTAPRFLDLGTRRKCYQIHTLYRMKEPPMPV